jgi:hypothetical protein
MAGTIATTIAFCDVTPCDRINGYRCSSEKSVNIYLTTRRHIAEGYSRRVVVDLEATYNIKTADVSSYCCRSSNFINGENWTHPIKVTETQ